LCRPPPQRHLTPPPQLLRPPRLLGLRLLRPSQRHAHPGAADRCRHPSGPVMGQPRGANMAGQVKPPFAYYGGKTTLAPQIAALLPTHDHYVEPFAGSLAVLLAKTPSRAETVNDLDGDLMTFWRVLRDRPTEFERVCALTPHSRAELVVAADLDVEDDLERARRVFVRLTQSRSHSMKQTGWWSDR